MSRPCELCGKDPAQGMSSITDGKKVAHPLCHPDRPWPRRRPLSCFEIVAYVLVEDLPHGRRPPVAIPEETRQKARDFIARNP